MWGRLVCQIRAGGEVVCIRVGGTVWNNVKGCGIEKRGGKTKILKCGGQAGSRGSFFKKEAENAFTNYGKITHYMCCDHIFSQRNKTTKIAEGVEVGGI